MKRPCLWQCIYSCVGIWPRSRNPLLMVANVCWCILSQCNTSSINRVLCFSGPLRPTRLVQVGRSGLRCVHGKWNGNNTNTNIQKRIWIYSPNHIYKTWLYEKYIYIYIYINNKQAKCDNFCPILLRKLRINNYACFWHSFLQAGSGNTVTLHHSLSALHNIVFINVAKEDAGCVRVVKLLQAWRHVNNRFSLCK